eukprot:gene19858-biopygen5533
MLPPALTQLAKCSTLPMRENTSDVGLEPKSGSMFPLIGGSGAHAVRPSACVGWNVGRHHLSQHPCREIANLKGSVYGPPFWCTGNPLNLTPRSLKVFPTRGPPLHPKLKNAAVPPLTAFVFTGDSNSSASVGGRSRPPRGLRQTAAANAQRSDREEVEGASGTHPPPFLPSMFGKSCDVARLLDRSKTTVLDSVTIISPSPAGCPLRSFWTNTSPWSEFRPKEGGGGGEGLSDPGLLLPCGVEATRQVQQGKQLWHNMSVRTKNCVKHKARSGSDSDPVGVRLRPRSDSGPMSESVSDAAWQCDSQCDSDSDPTFKFRSQSDRRV